MKPTTFLHAIFLISSNSRPGLDRTQFLLVLFQVRGKFHAQLTFLFFFLHICVYIFQTQLHVFKGGFHISMD